MANTNLFIMKKGSKPGDTPTVGANPNAYYDTPTNPLVVCTDTLTADTTVACYEVRNDNSLPKNGKPVATGVLVNNGSGYSTSVSTIVVDTVDPRIKFKVGHYVYKSDGTLLGTISSMTDVGIVFTANILASLADDDPLFTAQGVSNSDEYNILNRIYPNTAATSELYLENLENTPGYRILCATYQADGTTVSAGQNMSSINITTDDYFVMINADDPLKHHFAKITSVTNSDVAGDSFEFSPKYGSELSKGTKFTIWKGPPTTDTAVVAVSYGLYGNAVNYASDSDETDGTGAATDSRHAGMTYISKPIFYFYNDRLNKNNELDHNSKYMLHYSRSDDGTETHYKRCFLTCQDYGLKAVDYGPYTMNATMVDKARENDNFHSDGAYSIAIDDTTDTNSYTVDVEEWDECFINNKRNDDNLLFGKTWESTTTSNIPEGSFMGPTKYLHYDTSPDLNNIVPEVIELNVFDSINETGGYIDARIVDSKRIYGSKIKDYDTIKVKKLIDTGTLSNDYVGLLPGTITGSTSDAELTINLTNNNQDLRVLLKSGSSYEDIKIGNYIYNIISINAPNTSNNTQVIEIEFGRLPSMAYFGISGTTSGLGENLTDANLYRKPWSKICQNLIVDFTIDTTVNYTNAGLSTQSETIVYGNNTSTTGSASGSRLYNSEIILTSGQQTGLSFKIDYGDSNHNIIKLQSPRLQLYRSETADEPNFLSYYNGRYSVYKTIFIGEVESLENYVEDGMLKYHLAGRNKINKLLGPIVNKDYTHSNDIVYSTIGPIERIYSTVRTGLNDLVSYSATVTNNMAGVSTITYLGALDAQDALAGDLLFDNRGYFIGRVYSNDGTTLTLEEGTLINLSDQIDGDSTQTLNIIRPNRNSISFAKAMSKNTINTNSVSSLKGASNKGLIFTSGNKLTDDSYGRPNVSGATLVGTSSSSESNALGYYLNYPNSVGIDEPFYADLKDEINNSEIERHTVNSLTEYDIVSIDSGEGSTLIEVAPNCPIIMGRIDENPADTTLETLSISAYKFAGAESEGEYGVFTIDGAPAAMYSALNDKHLYLSDGTYLGKMLGLEYKTASDAYITFDRKLPRAISADEYIYTSTQKTNGLYLINTQGLRPGGILQLVNSELSSSAKPIIYNVALDSNYSGSLNWEDLNNRHGGFTFRYLNLQKSNKGGIYYNKMKLTTGEPSNTYSNIKGEFNAYAPSYRIIPNIITTQTIHDMGINNDYTNSHEKQGSPETRGIYSATGGNFGDRTIYATGNENYDYTFMPKVRSNTVGGPWNVTLTGDEANSSNEAILGIKNNAISNCKDNWEIIDPKCITPFLFSPADMWPDSMMREHHIGNISRNFTDYNIMLRSKPKLLKSNIKHRNYLGTGNYLEETDNSYQTLNISNASINTNEMKRLGLMRLIECTYDWHFNLVDPENPPDNKKLVDIFDYTRYQKVISSGVYVQSGGYSSSDTVIATKDAASGGSAADPRTPFAQGGVYDNEGNYIGTVSSTDASSITLTAAAKKPNGSLYTGLLYRLNNSDKGGANNKTYYPYQASGRGGKSTYLRIHESSKSKDTADSTSLALNPVKLHMLQSALFNGNSSETSTNFSAGMGAGTGSEYDNYFKTRMGMTNSDTLTTYNLHHISLPPVFEGFELFLPTYSLAGVTTLFTPNSAITGGSTTSFQYNSSVNTPASLQLAAGDKLYNHQGDFIGIIDSINNTGGNSVITLTAAAECDAMSGTTLYRGDTVNSSGDYMATTSVNTSGYHPLAGKKEVARNGTPTNDFMHPSKVLQSLQRDIYKRVGGANKTVYNGSTLGFSIYSSLRAICLSNFRVENSGEEKVEEGASIICATNNSVHSIFPHMGNNYEASNTVYKGTSYLINTPHEVFALYKITEEDGTLKYNAGTTSGGSGDAGTTIATGANIVFKPLLITASSDTHDRDFGYISPNGQTDVTMLSFDTSANIRNKWLDFVPNLTGCYLVSNDGPRIEDDSSINGNSIFTKSIHDRYPTKIHYIISHTIRTNSTPGAGTPYHYHQLIIDNCASSGELEDTYRIMRPAHVCLWPNSPTEIDLYKMSSHYTKKPNSEEMYDDIAHIQFYEKGFKKGDRFQYDYNEGIQSMYVPINPDHTSTNRRFLVPRHTNSDHGNELFGDGKPFNNGSYDMLMNDGIQKNRRNINITTNTTTIGDSFGSFTYTKLNYGEQVNEKMSGVISLGEIFTLTSDQETNLSRIETASIGTTVKICSEAEDIINDMLEENDIIYDNSTITYPYFTGPNIQGADIYNSSKFLAGYKNKELLIDKDDIKLISNNATTRYTDIEINENDSNVNIIEIEQNKSGFDIYNEIIIYGDGVKSIKQNIHSIKKIGKKTLEELHENLSTQIEVDNKAKNLLNFYNKNEKKVTIKLSNKNMEWVKSGDIIVIDYPSEHIPRGDYIILEVKHETSGILTIQAGGYSKALDSRLAEIIMNNKKMASFLRSKQFKSPTVNYNNYDSIKLKPIQIIATKTTVSGDTTIGLTTTLGFGTLLKIGTRTTTEVLREDLT